MNYRIGPVGITCDTRHTSPAWQARIHSFLSTTFAGLETHNPHTQTTCTIVFSDYALRPHITQSVIAPGQFEYTRTHLHDIDKEIFYDFSEPAILRIWTHGIHLNIWSCIQLILARVGATLLHAASLKTPSGVLLVPTVGHALAPSTLAEWLLQDERTQLMSPEFTIIDQDGMVWPIQTPLTIAPNDQPYFSYFERHPAPRQTRWKLTYRIIHTLLAACGKESFLERIVNEQANICIPLSKLFAQKQLCSTGQTIKRVTLLTYHAGNHEPSHIIESKKALFTALTSGIQTALHNDIHTLLMRSTMLGMTFERFSSLTTSTLSRAFRDVPESSFSTCHVSTNISASEMVHLLAHMPHIKTVSISDQTPTAQ